MISNTFVKPGIPNGRLNRLYLALFELSLRRFKKIITKIRVKPMKNNIKDIFQENKTVSSLFQTALIYIL